MDPSANLCLLYDTFKEDNVSNNNENVNNWYNNVDELIFDINYVTIDIKEQIEPIYCDINKYNILQKVKDTFNNENFIQARNITNPFENIGRSIFINRAAVKLANIDAVYNVTKDIFTWNKKISNENFTFADIAAGPGGFTQYLQYRYPNSIGYGITLKDKNLDWSTNFLNMKRFKTYYGPDNTGNLYSNWDNFINFVLQEESNGVDLITADGGIDVEDTNLYSKQEFLSSRLLLTQVLVGIRCTKVGGNFVLKVFDTVTNLSAQIIYLLSRCFSNILIFKPVTSRPANAERYIICKDRKENINDIYNMLVQGEKLYTDQTGNYLISLFSNSLPADFIEWLTLQNNISINLQLTSAQNILLYMKGNNPNIIQYNIPKFLLIWNLPDTPISNNNDKIRVL